MNDVSRRALLAASIATPLVTPNAKRRRRDLNRLLQAGHDPLVERASARAAGAANVEAMQLGPNGKTLTAINYAASGLAIWPIAGWMLAGGLVGGAIGVWASRKLAGQRALRQRLFAIFVLVVAVYVGWRAIAPQSEGGDCYIVRLVCPLAVAKLATGCPGVAHARSSTQAKCSGLSRAQA